MIAALSPLVSWVLVLTMFTVIALIALVAHLTIQLRHARALNRAWSYSLQRRRTP